ncbi:MAG: hypothetical protein FJ221_00960 [Lentisphaerae bacterium]|nr:hypothetical protein [Lentisphaerota bacterium]
MQVSFRCPNCQCKMAIDAAAAGEAVTCPQCRAKVTVPQARLGPGVTLGGFRIERLVGAGGMGEVYLARQLSMDRPVALKILAAHARSREDKERFIQEVRTLARLEHPNIVTAHEAGEDGGHLFLAMGYVNGEALDRRLASQGRIPEREALKIVRKVGKALEYAWSEHRLLHRDIKPGNILIDAHGEPKLVDLGLAHSVQSAESGRAEKPRAAGTPNYMSPEQAEGRDDLDCRSDIYALGATLYHTITGQLPYAADTPDETLRLKFAEPLPDPRSLNPQVTPSCVALLTGMLSHDRAERYSTWKELLTDVDRVLSGKPPAHSALPGEHTNRVRLTAAEVQALQDSARSARRESPIKMILTVAATVLVVGGGIAVALWLRDRMETPPPTPHRTPQELAALKAEEDARVRLAALEARYRETLQFHEAHADDIPACVQRWKDLARDAERTEWGALAQKEIQKLARRAEEEAAKAYAALAASVQPLVEAGESDAAILKLEAYTGPYAAETLAQRTAEADRIRARAAAMAAERQSSAAKAFDTARRDAIARLVKLDYAGALSSFETACRSGGLDPAAGECVRWRNTILAAQRQKDIVLESVRGDSGKTVELQLAGGPESWEITGIEGGAIQARRKVGGGYMARTIAYTELHLVEKYRRLERIPAPANRILQALLLMEAGNPAMARKTLEPSEDEVARALLDAMDTEARASAETTAERTLALLLKRLGIPEGTGTAEAASRIRRTPFTAVDVQTLRAAAADFRRVHGGTSYAARTDEILLAIEKVNTYPREVDSAAVGRAIDNLKRANPGSAAHLDESLRQTGDGLEFVAEGAAAAGLSSLAPLAGLPVVRIVLTAPALRDLASLRGLPLQEIEIRGARIENLDALRGLPLKRLALVRCGIENLAPLTGLALESLDLSQNRIASFSPLAGMPLKRLVLSDNTQIATLRYVSGMPIEELACDNCAKIDDLKPLRGSPLKSLSIENTAVADLSALKDSTIETLNIGGCRQVKDLAPLKSMPLRKLTIWGLPLEDLGALDGLALQHLHAADIPALASIAGLRGMPLESLTLRDTGVTDLTPLQGMPLKRLVLARTPITEVAVLADLPIEYLDISHCDRIRDPTSIEKCASLTTIVIPDRPRYRYMLRTMKSLKYAGTSSDTLLPITEFLGESEEALRAAPAAQPPAEARPPRPAGARPPRPAAP